MPHRPIIDYLRAEICLASADAPLVLHEGAIAKHFGVSRTPVRQALQSLVYEGVLEVRPGVGTVCPPLDPNQMDRAYVVYREIASAAANYAHLKPISEDARRNICGCAGAVSASQGKGVREYVQIVGQLAESMSGFVDDHILANALSAAHWRLFRWRVEAFKADPGSVWETLEINTKRIVDALEFNDAGYVMRTAAGISGSFLQSAPKIAV